MQPARDRRDADLDPTDHAPRRAPATPELDRLAERVREHARQDPQRFLREAEVPGGGE